MYDSIITLVLFASWNHKDKKFYLFECWFLLFTWKTVVNMNCNEFVEAAIIEPIIMAIFFVQFHPICLFDKLLLKWISSFFVEVTIYEPIIMLMPLAWWRHQNNKIFVCGMLNASVYLGNCCWHEFQGFLWKRPSMSL